MLLTAKTWITELIESITSVFTDLGKAILGFVKTGFNELFFEEVADGAKTLSDFAVFVFVLMGISVVMGLTYWITNLIHRSH